MLEKLACIRRAPGSSCAQKCHVQQGVRQRRALSPWLFLCFNNAANSSMLTVNYIPCYPVMVADDITILSSRVKGLQEQHDTLGSYSCRWRFDFNTSKTIAVT